MGFEQAGQGIPPDQIGEPPGIALYPKRRTAKVIADERRRVDRREDPAERGIVGGRGLVHPRQHKWRAIERNPTQPSEILPQPSLHALRERWGASACGAPWR